MKFRIGDMDPRHLSAKPFGCMLMGIGAFGIAAWCVAIIGTWWWWLVAVAGLLLAALGVAGALREKRELEASDKERGR